MYFVKMWLVVCDPPGAVGNKDALGGAALGHMQSSTAATWGCCWYWPVGHQEITEEGQQQQKGRWDTAWTSHIHLCRQVFDSASIKQAKGSCLISRRTDVKQRCLKCALIDYLLLRQFAEKSHIHVSENQAEVQPETLNNCITIELKLANLIPAFNIWLVLKRVVTHFFGKKHFHFSQSVRLCLHFWWNLIRALRIFTRWSSVASYGQHKVN